LQLTWLLRTLPKRIVDLALVDKDNTILCADKFGDVFGLPFFPPASDSESTEQTTGPSEVATDNFKMDIDDRTFESEEQKQRYIEKQKAHVAREKAAAERRKRLQVEYNIPFAHDFILGHVSMLLCLSTVTLPADHPEAAGKEKTWVLTGDRDEHIRVTRYPQSYVIDGFCLGHTQFVKTMLTPSWNLTSLISGGGDEFLLVWNWRQGKVLQKVDLVAPVQGALGAETKIFVPKTGDKHEAEQVDDSVFKIAVRGLWEVPAVNGVLVAVESVPALFLFSYASGSFEYTSTLALTGNVLDTAVKQNNIFVSVDPADKAAPLVEEHVLDQAGQWTPAEGDVAATVSGAVVKAVDLDEALIAAITPNVLYPVKSLRKEYGLRDREE
jgi:tRNA (guanine-N(7)-)-methyltransferase subunit TRM82